MRATMEASCVLEVESERAAFAEARRERDAKPEQLGELLRQMQPEAGAFVPARRGRVDLAEGLEQLGLVLGADAGAGVGDLDRAERIGSRRMPNEPHRHVSGVGVLDRVAEEIDDDL